MRQSGRAAALLAVVALAGCAYGTTQLRLPAPAEMAQPELDLLAGARHRWLTEATPADIDDVIAHGYRLFRLDEIARDRFTAAFVGNEGDFARVGAGWASGLTRAEAEAKAADPSLRIVDVSVTMEHDEPRFALVWLGNGGPQAKRWRLVLGAPSLVALAAEAEKADLRITDLEVAYTSAGPQYAAVMVESGSMRRRQWLGQGSVDSIREAIVKLESESGRHQLARVIALDHAIGHVFAYVIEQRTPDEPPWWYADLESLDPQVLPPPESLQRTDDVAALPVRLGGRFTELKRYTVDGDVRYLAILNDNEPLPQSGPPAADDRTLKAIDGIVQRGLKFYGIPGAALAVCQGSRLVYAQGYGHSHLAFGAGGAPRVATPETMFRVASVSKSLTALAMLQLIERGAKAPVSGRPLSLDTRPFGEIFADTLADPQLATVTLRELLQHQTAWPAGLDWAFDPADWARHPPPAVHTKRAEGRFIYQNSNYHLLTRIIEAVTSQSYASYVTRNLFEPLGVRRIRISSPRAHTFTPATPQEAASYDGVTRHFRQSWNGERDRWDAHDTPSDGDWILSNTARFGGGSWAASPIDLLRVFSVADGSVPGPRVLGDFRAVVDEARNVEPGGYHLGFWYGPVGDGVNALSNGGYLPGLAMAAFSLREDGIKFAVFFNGDISAQQLGRHHDRATPNYDGGERFVVTRLHALFDGDPLPARDLWADYGFGPTSVSPVAVRDATKRPVAGRRAVSTAIPATSPDEAVAGRRPRATDAPAALRAVGGRSAGLHVRS